MEINSFDSLTVFVLASNETDALKETVYRIKNLQYIDDISKIIIVAKNTLCPAYSEAKKLEATLGDLIELYVQKSDSFALCMAEMPLLVNSSHFVIVASDGEMEIENIDVFISKAKKHPERIICAAKWHKDSVVEGYAAFNKFGSRLLNTFISVLFNKNIKDSFSLFQIYPISVYHKLNFNNPKTFGYEYTVKALRNGIEYEEIPTFYKKRTDGKTNFTYLKLFKIAVVYCLIAVKVRFEKKLMII